MGRSIRKEVCLNTFPGLGVEKMKVGGALLGLLPAVASVLVYSDCREGEGSLYDHSLTLLMDSRNVSLSELSGKVVLLTNVASY